MNSSTLVDASNNSIRRSGGSAGSTTVVGGKRMSRFKSADDVSNRSRAASTACRQPARPSTLELSGRDSDALGRHLNVEIANVGKLQSGGQIDGQRSRRRIGSLGAYRRHGYERGKQHQYAHMSHPSSGNGGLCGGY